jgi:hypothetical protein
MKVSARRVFVGLAIALLPSMIAASYYFGVTWDEKTRHFYGETVWRFLAGDLDRSAFTTDGAALYGAFFDVAAVATERWLPFNRYVIRHALGAGLGWLGIVYCGRLAGKLFGDWAGVLGLVLLAASPRYFADAMNNPKDLPFAALTVVALYYIATISPKWPYVTLATAVGIVVPLALALNVRAGALLYLGYFGLLVLIYAAIERPGWRAFADTAIRLSLVTAATMLLGTIFWPWAQGSPFVRPIQAAIGLSNFPWDGLVLFAGGEYGAEHLPRYYGPWWLLISTPPVVLAGVALSVAGPARTFWTRAGLGAVALLPVALAVVRHATLYDGIRHLLFVYPVFVVLAAGGWSDFTSGARQVWVRRGAQAALAVGLAAIFVFNVRAFPNQGVYFNGLVGGPRGAFAKYDEDYWGNCIQQAVAWSAEVARRSGRPVGVSGDPWHIVQLDSERYSELFYAPPPSLRYHFDIRLNRGSIAAVEGLATRPDALHRVETPDGAVLCVVLPGPAYPSEKSHLRLDDGQG